MHFVSIPCMIMASINFYVGIYHLFLFFKRRKMTVHLAFALLCLCVCLYDLFCIGLYNSTNFEQGIQWQRLQLITVNFISIFVIFFIYIFTNQKKNRILYFYIYLFIFLFLASLATDQSYSLPENLPSVKNINTGFLNITYYEAEMGILFQTGIFAALTVYLYLVYILYRYFLTTRDRNSLIIIGGMLIYFLGVINDSCIAAGIHNFIYLSEYSFLIIIVAMSYVLMNDFVNLHFTVEQYNLNLERIVDARTKEIQNLNTELKHRAEIDALTGAYNRHFFNTYFELEVKRAKNEIEHRYSNGDMLCDMNFGLAIFDIDDFKKINDTHGHLAGDSVLVEIVRIIKSNIFTRDILCRYGGEEFILLFTRTTAEGIVQAVEKIRREIDEHVFRINTAVNELHITISIGVVIFDEVHDAKYDDILKIADDRLLAAKRAGKNRSIFS